MTDVELPYLTEGYLGPQSKFEPYGMYCISHPDPVIHSNTNKLEIVIGINDKVKFLVKFKQMEPKREINQCVFSQMMGDKLHFSIAVSEVGFYKFEIYALPSDEAGPNMINVYNYLLNIKTIDTYVEPYPKQYPLWKQEGCFVFEPIMLPKGINYPVRFKYFIPHAIDVQIKVGEDWNQLQQSEPGIYDGFVDFTRGYQPGTKVRLNVKSGRSNKYDILLEYTL
ncbi:hypothetical protein CHS0354_037765 [Potamilus streckersoni]|uniref:KY-like immunoglobulin-like domain-containing protein n=1 Tax=Potamilus streckersoni TaxID=2493646 RepID=A0AAE0T3V9_9BIVA|nr:hypothetical protein CHS0354_037765 [Potamilus streckersoni]